MKEQVYEYLISFISDVGYPPTVREIADHFHISTSTARYVERNVPRKEHTGGEYPARKQEKE